MSLFARPCLLAAGFRRNRLRFAQGLGWNGRMTRRPRRLGIVLGVLCTAASATSSGQRGGQPPAATQQTAAPLSPAQSLAGFELEAGYRIELAAAEPLIKSPVAMAFDERGRMYVVENRGYPGPLEGVVGTPAAEGIIAL